MHNVCGRCGHLEEEHSPKCGWTNCNCAGYGTYLGPKEVEILTLLCGGHSSAQIAKALGNSYKTVETHIFNIRRKVGVNDRTQLVALALRLGVIDLTKLPPIKTEIFIRPTKPTA